MVEETDCVCKQDWLKDVTFLGSDLHSGEKNKKRKKHNERYTSSL